MPDNHLEDVVLRLDFGNIQAVGRLVETHHPEHAAGFVTHGARQQHQREHLPARGIAVEAGLVTGKQLAQVGKNLHLHAAFLGAESRLEQVQYVGARHVDDGATEPAGGFRDGLYVKRLQEQVEGCRRFPIVRPLGQKIADVEALAVNLEYRAQEAVERRIVGDEERHAQM